MNIRKALSVFTIIFAGFSLVACNNGDGGDPGSSDPSATRKASASPLHAAASRNDDAGIRDIIAQGTNANVQLKNGQTPLHIAATGGQMRAATALLQAGADPTIQDDRGETPLMLAASRGNAGIVREMLAKRPNVNSQNKKWGKTALYFTAERNHPDIAVMLMQAGADASIADYKGRTPMDVAQAKGNTAVIDALQGKRPAAAPGSMGGSMTPPATQPGGSAPR